MIRFTILFFATLLFSCKQSDKIDAPLSETIERDSANIISLSDLIPEHLTDSLKVEMIAGFIKEINLDTSLVTKEIIDTIESNFIIRNLAKYRNDTLVKLWVIRGSNSFGSEETTSIYYFLQNELICVEESCSGGPESAMCNWVYAEQIFYLYNGKIIEKDFKSEIQTRRNCGCYFWIKTHKEAQVKNEIYEAQILEEVQNLKKKFS